MNRTLRLLLIEDSEDDAVLLQRTLKRSGYDLTAFRRVENAGEMREALAAHSWDVIIADYSLPGFSGLIALKIAQEVAPDLPFIVVSGTIGEDVAVATMRAGAHDYLMKNNLTRLAPAIQRELDEAAERRAHRQAEEQLRKLSRAVDQSPSLVIITNLQGDIEYVNPRFTAITGYPAEEVLGRNPRLLKSGRMSAADYANLWETITAGGIWQGELYNRRKSGEYYWAAATMSPIKDADGQITHFLSVQEDITERKLAEQALRESEERFRQLVEYAADAFFLHDLNGYILNVNQRACESLGYDRDELIGLHVSQIEVGYDLAQLRRIWNDVRQRERVTVSGWHRRKDNSTFPVEVSIGMLEIEGQTLLLGLARDMTERYELQAALKQYNEQLEELVAERTQQLGETMEQMQAILHNSSDAIALVQVNGDIQATNTTFQQMFGSQVNQTIEQILSLLSETRHIEAMSHSLFEVLQGGAPTRVEVEITRQNGDEFDADVALTPVATPDGKMTGLVISLRDITHIKDAERFKTRFIANIAHDIANPITNLKMHLHAIKRAPDRLDRHLEALNNQVRHMESLVHDLRMLSQLDRGQAFFTLTDLPLNPLVEDVVAGHQPMAQSKLQTLRFLPCPETPVVRADREKLARAVANLITNALNYTPERGTITVSTAISDDKILLQVQDDGIGIAPEHLPHVFDRFYRTDDARTSGVEGSGLGLSIVKEIVEAHKGAITVDSALQEGSTFSVWLPLSGEANEK